MTQYLYNLLLLISQTASTLLGGHPDESISQRTARAYLAHKDRATFKNRWFTIQLKAIDAIFYNRLWKIEQNHCINSLTGEAGAREVWNWSK